MRRSAVLAGGSLRSRMRQPARTLARSAGDARAERARPRGEPRRLRLARGKPCPRCTGARRLAAPEAAPRAAGRSRRRRSAAQLSCLSLATSACRRVDLGLRLRQARLRAAHRRRGRSPASQPSLPSGSAHVGPTPRRARSAPARSPLLSAATRSPLPSAALLTLTMTCSSTYGGSRVRRRPRQRQDQQRQHAQVSARLTPRVACVPGYRAA